MYCTNCGNKISSGTGKCSNCNEERRTKVKTISEIFFDSREIFYGERNGADCLVYDIPDKIRNEVRSSFDISFEEQILFMRDTSFWNSKNQGTLLTDKAIYLIPNNEKPQNKTVLPWASFDFVEYKDLVLYFFKEREGQVEKVWAIHLSYLLKTSTSKSGNYIPELGCKLAKLFTDIAQSIEPEIDPAEIVWDDIHSLIDDKNYIEASAMALAYAREHDEPGFILLAVYAAFLYFHSDDNSIDTDKDEDVEYLENIINLCNEGLIDAEEESFLGANLLANKASALYLLCKWQEARVIFQQLNQQAGNLRSFMRDTLIKDYVKKILPECDASYSKSFLDQPYEERKLLVTVDKYTELNQQYISVIKRADIRDTQINFPVGHPVRMQLYVGHPYINTKYIPFENYELELVEDKVREYCMLAQCLGATEITIGSQNSVLNDRQLTEKLDVSGELSIKFASGSGKYHKDESGRLMDEIAQSIGLHQKYNPTGKPMLPPNLLYYHNEPSWQRLYEQRMRGSLLEHEERIETKKSRLFESSELSSISGEFKNLLIKASGSWERSMEESFSVKENTVLSIKVHFAPLEDLIPDNTKIQYPEISNAQEITDYQGSNKVENSSEKKSLSDRFRSFLGLKNRNSSEVEEKFTYPENFSENEKEYLLEYRYCKENGNGISESERRLLNRLQIRLGISDDRAYQIEKMV